MHTIYMLPVIKTKLHNVLLDMNKCISISEKLQVHIKWAKKITNLIWTEIYEILQKKHKYVSICKVELFEDSEKVTYSSEPDVIINKKQLCEYLINVFMNLDIKYDTSECPIIGMKFLMCKRDVYYDRNFNI